MNIPKNLKYTQEHEWVGLVGKIATVGITEYAQGELGDIVFVELPAVGAQTKRMESFGTIEAVKAVSDVFAPVSGEIVEVNTVLSSAPETINKDPYGEGWIIKIKINAVSEMDQLLSSDDYEKLIG